MFDLSQVTELVSLARVVRIFERAAEPIAERTLIVGATARDLILHHAYGLPIMRATADLDIAIAIRSWNDFERLAEGLIAEGMQRDSRVPHRFSRR